MPAHEDQQGFISSPPGNPGGQIALSGIVQFHNAGELVRMRDETVNFKSKIEAELNNVTAGQGEAKTLLGGMMQRAIEATKKVQTSVNIMQEGVADANIKLDKYANEMGEAMRAVGLQETVKTNFEFVHKTVNDYNVLQKKRNKMIKNAYDAGVHRFNALDGSAKNTISRLHHVDGNIASLKGATENGFNSISAKINGLKRTTVDDFKDVRGNLADHRKVIEENTRMVGEMNKHLTRQMLQLRNENGIFREKHRMLNERLQQMEKDLAIKDEVAQSNTSQNDNRERTLLAKNAQLESDLQLFTDDFTKHQAEMKSAHDKFVSGITEAIEKNCNSVDIKAKLKDAARTMSTLGNKTIDRMKQMLKEVQAGNTAVLGGIKESTAKPLKSQANIASKIDVVAATTDKTVATINALKDTATGKFDKAATEMDAFQDTVIVRSDKASRKSQH
ncbi:hypothetical protein ACN47E_003340 [Coniothyrium glycines]